VSKERALRRAERERVAAEREAAASEAAERAARRTARREAVTSRLPSLGAGGGQVGILARRRRQRVAILVAALVALNIVLWLVRPDAGARVLGAIVSVLCAPVLFVLLFPRP